MTGFPPYILRCEPPKGCGWWWEVYPARRHRWSRITRRYRGPYWPADPISDGAPRWQAEDEWDDNLFDCARHLVRHEFTEGLAWRGVRKANG